MSKGDAIQTQGEIGENLTDAKFRVKLENGNVALGHVSGQDADEPQPHPAWREGHGRTDAVRFKSCTDCFPRQVRSRRRS